MPSNKQYIFFNDVDSVVALTNPDCSYFWITSLKTYNKYKVYAYDELTAERLYKTYPGFQGIDDMEGHFEFTTNAEVTKQYLIGLGMLDGGQAD
jgi:hypothetical protein